MNFLEKDLEEIIFCSDAEHLKQRGLRLKGKPKRQLRIGSYGIADLVYFNRVSTGINPHLEINVVELKKDKIGISALLQAVGYCRGIDRYLQKRDFSSDYYFNIILIGREVDTSGNLVYLTDLINGGKYSYSGIYYYGHCLNKLSFYRYEYDIDGISFIEESGYQLTNEDFDVKA